MVKKTEKNDAVENADKILKTGTLKLQTSSLSTLSEDQLFVKLREHIQSMSDFTLKTKNCHKEVKDEMADMVRVFNCYASKKKTQKESAATKMFTGNKCSTCDRKTKLKTTQTQTEDSTEIQDEKSTRRQKMKDGETSTPCW